MTQRFRDWTAVEDLDRMGVRLNGMPDVHSATIYSITKQNVSQISFLIMKAEITTIQMFAQTATAYETIKFNVFKLSVCLSYYLQKCVNIMSYNVAKYVIG